MPIVRGREGDDWSGKQYNTVHNSLPNIVLDAFVVLYIYIIVNATSTDIYIDV
jgi:hypothetical protein